MSETTIPLHFQLVGMVLYAIGRIIIFAMFFSNVGKRFGYENYGILTGVGNLTSALLSLLQYPLISWTVSGNDAEVNIFCGCWLLGLLPYCVWLHFHERRDVSTGPGKWDIPLFCGYWLLGLLPYCALLHFYEQHDFSSGPCHKVSVYCECIFIHTYDRVYFM